MESKETTTRTFPGRIGKGKLTHLMTATSGFYAKGEPWTWTQGICGAVGYKPIGVPEIIELPNGTEITCRKCCKALRRDEVIS